MSDPTDAGAELPQVAPHEELASALFDGEATAADQARADAPDVARALQAHREVARRVGAPVEPSSTADRERAIAAALAAFVAGESDEPVEARGDDELAARRARRATPQWIAAIAAALVVLAGLGLLAGLSGGGDDDESGETASALTTDETVASEGGATDDGGIGGGDSGDTLAEAAEEAAGAELPTSGSAASLPHLGEFADAAEVVASARREFAARQAAGTSTSAVEAGDAAPQFAVPCSAAVDAVPDAIVLGTATVDGALVTILVQVTEGRETVIALAEPTCEPDRFEP